MLEEMGDSPDSGRFMAGTDAAPDPDGDGLRGRHRAGGDPKAVGKDGDLRLHFNVFASTAINIRKPEANLRFQKFFSFFILPFSATQQGLGHDDVMGPGDLEIRFVMLDQGNLLPRGNGNRDLIGRVT
jgi:hypothetical protein